MAASMAPMIAMVSALPTLNNVMEDVMVKMFHVPVSVLTPLGSTPPLSMEYQPADLSHSLMAMVNVKEEEHSVGLTGV